MDELKQVFLEEAEDLFSNINDILFSLENREITDEELDSLFRDYHTLKGGSGSVGFEQFVKLVHLLETFLDKLKNKHIVYIPEITDFLIDTTEKLEVILKQEANNQLDKNVVEDLLTEISQSIENFEHFEHNKRPLDLRGGDEIVDILDKLKLMKEHHHLPINETFRLVHTLKSGAMMLGLDSFKEFVSLIESQLMYIRDNNIQDEERIYSIISLFLEYSEQILNNELNGNIKLNKQIIENISKQLNKNDDIGFVLFDEKIDELKQPSKNPIKKSNKKEKQELQKSFKDLISSSSIRVNLEKIDNLMNRVGDLVITKSMLYDYANSFEDFDIKNSFYEKLDVLDRNIRELQDAVMSVRMISMDSIYSKIPKIIRDISKKLNKKVKFEHYGDNVEIDKLMSESLMDPLTHILRNALDHGIETPEERKRLHKPVEGKIVITASQESGHIVLKIEDDGRGIDAQKVAKKALENGVITQEEYERMSEDEKIMLIFAPGLSTADKVSDISGRGVGMDVVMNNINAIGGKIKVKTKLNKGTTFIISIPLTLAILDGLNIKIGEFEFIIPLNMIIESFQPIKSMIKQVIKDNNEIIMLRDEFIPVIRLHKFFGITPKYSKLTDGIIIISMVGSKKVALFIDEFFTQAQIVVKSLDKNYKKVKGISAATIRGDGSVGLILDVQSIVEENK